MKIETPNDEFPLPEAIIQHIQSFLDGRKAVQTSILSKSWYIAWYTRPNLEFDEFYFLREDLGRFWDMTRKTMQRYEEMKINIQSFKLFVTRGRVGDLIEEVIVKAIKMGTFAFEFKFSCYDDKFVLPREVFASETLIRLSVFGCEIDLGKERKVCCSGLKSLELPHDVGKDALGDILSSCPSIENLILKQPFFVVDYPPVNLHQLHKLNSLLLERIDVDNLFSSDLSSKFPLLKDLSLIHCRGYIQLSSPSLDCIRFTDCDHLLRVKCDVPNIRKLRIQGLMPSLSFKTASSGEWESDISIRCQHRGSVEWFLKLNKLLDCLSLSRITLFLSFWDGLEKDMVEFQGSGKTVVERLQIHARPTDYLLLLKCIFQSCRPKIITENWYCDGGRNNLLQNLCSILIPEVRGSGSSVFVVQGLKGVIVEFFEESLAEWRLLPWKKLLYDSYTPETLKKVRFLLTWLPELSHSGDAHMR